MAEWVTLYVFSVPTPTRLSAPILSPGALRDARSWLWLGAVGLTGIGTWWGLMRLAFMANAMHRRAVATTMLLLTLLVALLAAWLVAGALSHLVPPA